MTGVFTPVGRVGRGGWGVYTCRRGGGGELVFIVSEQTLLENNAYFFMVYVTQNDTYNNIKTIITARTL